MRVVRWIPLASFAVAVGAILALWLAGGLSRVVAWYLVDLVPFVAAPLTLGALGVWAVRRRLGLATRWTLLVAAPQNVLFLKAMAWVPVAFPASIATTTPAATVRLPSDAPLRVAWGGDTADVNYHVIDPAQRWAYDLVIEPAFHGSADLASYGCWETPVLAPASGTVVQIENSLVDHVPGVSSEDTSAACGNHVALRLEETGTHLLLCHMKNGSVRVNAGDRISEGQVVGRCGNSGTTSEPHIHLHHQRQPPRGPVLLGEGLPLYFRDHDGAPMPKGGIEGDQETVRATGDVVRHRRTGR